MNILVDSSGSMDSIASDMVGALNRLVDENRELDVLVSYSRFSNEYQPIFADKPIKWVRKFKLKPDKMTALIESCCLMIDEVGERLAAKPETERPEKVMFVVVTDGLENHSKPEYTRELLLSKIKEQTEVYNWVFLFLGANQDAIAVGKGFGINPDRAASYDPSHAGKVGKVLSRRLREVNGSAPQDLQKKVAFGESDRESLKKATT